MLATIWPSASVFARASIFGVALKCGPFLLAVGERFPRQQIRQFLMGYADQSREKSGLPDAVLLPDFQRDGLEALQHRRQPPRDTAIDKHFVNHLLLHFLAEAL